MVQRVQRPVGREAAGRHAPAGRIRQCHQVLWQASSLGLWCAVSHACTGSPSVMHAGQPQCHQWCCCSQWLSTPLTLQRAVHGETLAFLFCCGSSYQYKAALEGPPARRWVCDVLSAFILVGSRQTMSTDISAGLTWDLQLQGFSGVLRIAPAAHLQHSGFW